METKNDLELPDELIFINKYGKSDVLRVNESHDFDRSKRKVLNKIGDRYE